MVAALNKHPAAIQIYVTGQTQTAGGTPSKYLVNDQKNVNDFHQ